MTSMSTACPTRCASCTSSSVCTACSSGLILYQSSCFAACPIGSFLSGSTCSGLLMPFLVNRFAWLILATCYRHNVHYVFSYMPIYFFSLATACSVNCAKCSSGSLCTLCGSGYLNQGACAPACPLGTFISGSTTCEGCIEWIPSIP